MLTDAPPAPAEYDARMVGEPAGSRVAEVFNRREVQQASIPGSGGLFSARGLARHYAMLANWGELDGVRVLPEARIRAGIELQSFEWDEIYRIRARRALGYRRGIDTGPLASPEAFGHVGGGGSFGYADPARRLGIGFAKNYFTYLSGNAVNRGQPPRAPSNVVAEAVFDALELDALGLRQPFLLLFRLRPRTSSCPPFAKTDPAVEQVERHPADRPAQEWNVLGDQQQADRETPQAQGGQEPQESREDEQNAERYSHDARLRLAQPADGARQEIRCLLLEFLESLVEFVLPLFCSVLASCIRHSLALQDRCQR